MRLLRCSSRALCALAIVAVSASAQQQAPAGHSGLGFGVKAGVGFDPEQVVLGAQFSLGKAALRLLRVIPNVHLGFGDETTWDFNVDFLARIIFEGKGYGAYAGIAPTYTIYDGDNDFGGTWVVGAQLPFVRGRATNLEARFGFSGTPAFRLLAALVF
jgi:hypothetical protein